MPTKLTIIHITQTDGEEVKSLYSFYDLEVAHSPVLLQLHLSQPHEQVPECPFLNIECTIAATIAASTTHTKIVPAI